MARRQELGKAHTLIPISVQREEGEIDRVNFVWFFT